MSQSEECHSNQREEIPEKEECERERERNQVLDKEELSALVPRNLDKPSIVLSLMRKHIPVN